MRPPFIKKLASLACLLLVVSVNRTALAETAPDFTAERLTGGKFKLTQVLEAGRPVLLHFWDTCCPGCREALPAVQAISEEFAGRLTVIGISIDTPKTQSKVKPFVKSSGYKFEILIDPNVEVRKLFGGTETPCSILISPQREIVLKRIGVAKDEASELRTAVNTLLTQIEQTSTSTREPH